MWASAAFAAAFFLLALIHFPNKPKYAPSISAVTDRTSFSKGVKRLLAHRQFWLVGCAYGVMTGVQAGFSAYLTPNLENFLPDDTYVQSQHPLTSQIVSIDRRYVVDIQGGE